MNMLSLRDNDLSTWLVPLVSSGVPVPRTSVVKGAPWEDFAAMIEGRVTSGYKAFRSRLRSYLKMHGLPCFLRTGHTAGKHSWELTCFLSDADLLDEHVQQLVWESELAHVMGLPTETWAIRDLVATRPLFRAFGRGMPVVREFRAFFAGGRMTCIHPYWPADAIERPDRPDWRRRLDEASALAPSERALLRMRTEAVAGRFGGPLAGAWCIDWMQGSTGIWWGIDMCRADDAWHWPDCPDRAAD